MFIATLHYTQRLHAAPVLLTVPMDRNVLLRFPSLISFTFFSRFSEISLYFRFDSAVWAEEYICISSR